MTKQDNADFTPSTAAHIRPAQVTDCPTVYTFICDLEQTSFSKSQFQEIFGRNLGDPLVYYLVAEQEGEVVGFASCHVQYLLHHVGKVGEIQELYVRPDYRSQRIGRQLIDALTQLGIREGFVNLEVATNQKRTDAVRFYQRESFGCTHVKLVKPL